MTGASPVAVILPALDEEGAVAHVVTAFRKQGARVIVVDNGSTDATAARAMESGAEVVAEPRRGYGSACLAGIRHLGASPAPPEVVVFADCDGTLDAADMAGLVAPVLSGKADLVLGRRHRIAPGALPPHQRVGNGVVLLLLRALFGLRLRDVPPFRAVRWSTLARMALRECTYGFPVETLVRAHGVGARMQEVDVAYLARTSGESKVTGSLTRSVHAGAVMIGLCLRLRLTKGADP